MVTNDSSSLHGQAQLHGKLKVDAKELKEKKKVHIVPIAIGDNASVDDLKEIANPDRVISCEVFEIPSKLKHRIIQGSSSFSTFKYNFGGNYCYYILGNTGDDYIVIVA